MDYRFDQSDSYRKLKELASKATQKPLKHRFSDDNDRLRKFSLEWDAVYLDFSKQVIDEDIWACLLELAEEAGLKRGIEAMFSGERINETENRAVLHTALRDQKDAQRFFDGKNVMGDVHEVLQNMENFTNAVHQGTFLGASGEKITDVVSIGIGGSDLGPVMVSEALKALPSQVNLHYVSNVDGFHLENTLKHLQAKNTLFIVVSKTFTTQETMTNAQYAKKWLVKGLGEDAIGQHFAAVSTNIKAAQDFGIVMKNVFGFWDWVGGRYSLWGAVGLSIMMEYGAKVFHELLAGARAMDEHFQNTSNNKNLPVVLALLGIWNSNFLQHRSLAILPYAQGLHRFPAFLQQADMESNGKQCNKQGERINYQTGPVIWGEAGTNGQHAFYQLIHQGTQMIPADFIGFAKSMSKYDDHHEKLMANFIAQSEALMNGLDEEAVMADLEAQGLNKEERERLAPFKIFEGNRPSTSILFNALNPRTLGMLIAMYEHKIFVQGWIWNVYSFDQWGVELGKKLAQRVLPQIQGESRFEHDSSTAELIRRCKEMGSH
jgi:glucose-6-phosphate isomerase